MFISADSSEKVNTLINDYISNNKLSMDDVFINYKNNELNAYIYIKEEIEKNVDNFINKILTFFDGKLDHEIQYKENRIYISISTSNGNLLIGRNGKNLFAIENILKSYLKLNLKNIPLISLDIDGYKEKLSSRLIKTAIEVAKEVKFTGFDVSLENMNPYERLIIHDALKNFDGVYTESEGVEPNRHIVVKAKQ